MSQSIATIDSPEFINLEQLEINPLMSSCEIKVLYVGENRNHSFITKEVATEMSKTLRGAPIVGYYKESKEDFADHGQRVTFDDEGIKFECLTKPYGFVAPDAKVWFQKFIDTDEFGNETEREYLMTTGYLWTGQFEECADVISSGKGQSMELDENSLDGHWSQNVKSGMDFFIINDAVFSKLCILGDDVEPCFEGANVTAPDISKTFSLDNNFKKSLYTMIQDLAQVVSEGGQQMNEFENMETPVVEEVVEVAEEPVVEAAPEVQEEPVVETEAVEVEVEAAEEVVEVEAPAEEAPVASEFKKEEEEEDEESSEEEPEEEEEKADEDEDKKKYELLVEEHETLQNQFAELQAKYDELVEFKNSIEDAQKDELIEKFSMLSSEDVKDIVENKSNYTYKEIESQLSVLFARQKMAEEVKVEEEVPTTYNLNSGNTAVLPEWFKAAKDAEKNMN